MTVGSVEYICFISQILADNMIDEHVLLRHFDEVRSLAAEISESVGLGEYR